MDSVVLNNRYELLDKMGTGGMAYVYKANDLTLNRTVAVKTLKEEFAQDKDFIKRFKDEALSVAKLSHENIVNVYDVGYDNNLNYIVMECVEGTTLASYMETAGPLDEQEIIDISLQIVAALDHAHTNGIVHRDIKPQNILISKNGRIKVTDFGIAKAVNTQTLSTDNKAFGSVHYISPEQAKGHKPDFRTDIYSTGVVIYEMAVGDVPFDADTPVAVVMKHFEDTPVSPKQLRADISDELNRIILKALEKRPDDRYSSASDLMIDLKNMQSSVNGNPELTLDFFNGVDNFRQDTMSVPKISESDIFLQEDAVITRRTTGNIKGRNTGPAGMQSGRVPATPKSSHITFDDEYNVPLIYARGRKKKEKKYFFTTLIAILCVLAISTVFIVYAVDELVRVVVPEPKEYEVLNYVTYDYETIKKKLEQDFDIIVQKREVHSDETPAGIIMDQDVEQGRIFKEGVENSITFTVSIGGNFVDIPASAGEDYRIVERIFLDLGLEIEFVEQYNEEYDQGIVIRTSPAEGVRIRYGDEVRIYVSKGPEYAKTTVPDLTGLTREEAKSKLSQYGLEMNVMAEEVISGYTSTVTYQYPTANTVVYSSSVVDIKLTYVPEEKEYEEIMVPFLFNFDAADLADLEFPITLRFKVEYSDQSSSAQSTAVIKGIEDLPYERQIRIPAAGETKVTVFIGSTVYKQPHILKYFEFYSEAEDGM